MKFLSLIPLMGLLLSGQVRAAQPSELGAPTITMEDAIATARRINQGTVVGVQLDCPTQEHCGYLVRTQDPLGQAQTVYVATLDTPPSTGVSETLRESKPIAAKRPAGLDFRPAAFLTLGAGQSAGLGNVILSPLVRAGLDATLRHSAAPAWDADGTFELVYGRTESSDPATLSKVVSKPGLQEYRGQAHVIYNFHREGEIAKAGVGLYVDFARPIKTAPRYVPPDSNDAYAAEEGEIARSIFDTGLDFRFSVKQQLISSELHNVIFINGSRIAPNLLTYKPMLGFMWRNAFSITGTVDHPGLSLLTDVDFYFARKAGVRYFNAHDGLGGTKREIDLSLGLAYNIDPATRVVVKSYGYNNLNRGTSATVPFGFKDGLSLTLVRQFD